MYYIKMYYIFFIALQQSGLRTKLSLFLYIPLLSQDILRYFLIKVFLFNFLNEIQHSSNLIYIIWCMICLNSPFLHHFFLYQMPTQFVCITVEQD